ncbi:hypothetical protein ZWY2020_059969 [Hordeum vulgare]|nr:hypothetical protein ZWY2020_059969 [Hordeum vulgare]
MMVPFGEEYIIPEEDEEMEDSRSGASTPMDEKIHVDEILQVTTPPPQNPEMTVDEDIGYSTPMIHDEFWEEAHRNSPRTAQIPQTPAATEILTGSKEKSSHVESSQDRESAPSAKETPAPNTASAPSDQQIPQAEENAPAQNIETFYAPWIMRFIRTRSAINYQADLQNYLGYLRPLKVIKSTFQPVEGKGKSAIDEGNRPLDGQFHKAASYSSYDDTATQESDGKAKPPSPTAPKGDD